MVVYDSKLRFPPLSVRWRVGHDYLLVLLFAATRRQLALRPNQRGLASKPTPYCFFFIRAGQTIVYVIILYDSIKTKQKSTG